MKKKSIGERFGTVEDGRMCPYFHFEEIFKSMK